MRNYQREFAVLTTWAFVLCSSAAAFNISLQYPAGNLFSATYDATAKAAINQAAADISAAITTNLSAITNDVIVGSNGSTTATFDWSYQYTNPSTGGPTTINTATIAGNTITMYVGTRNIAGSTLGVGGPAGAGFQLSGNGFPNQWVSAVANAEAQSEAAYKRGGGPVIGTLEGSADLGGTVANYSIDFGVAYGSLSLDWNASGDGGWHFNHTTNPAAGKNDLYSVALHEMIHALGIGSSDTWEDKVAGTNWTGTNVINLNNGSGAGLINLAGDHITEGTLSTNAYNGSEQEAVMDPSITQGRRKYLTALDLAFLRDIGYSTINWAPPSTSGDFDDDGDVDGRDFLVWQRGGSPSPLSAGDLADWKANYGASGLAAIAAVPEPATGILCLIALALLGQRRGSR